MSREGAIERRLEGWRTLRNCWQCSGTGTILRYFRVA
jgi:hypothetical protein